MKSRNDANVLQWLLPNEAKMSEAEVKRVYSLLSLHCILLHHAVFTSHWLKTLIVNTYQTIIN